jgi:WD40 repeat protein
MRKAKVGVDLVASLPGGHLDRIIDVSWSPDGTRVASSSFDGTIRLWRPSEGASPIVSPLDPDGGIAYSVDWAPALSCLASAHEDGSIRIWDPESPGSPLTLPAFDKKASCVAWSPDGATLASGCGDSRIYLWRRSGDGWRHSEPLAGHSRGVGNLCWSPNGRRLASASYDRSVRVWDCLGGTELRCFRKHRDCVANVAWSPAVSMAASADDEGRVLVWDPANLEEIEALEGHEDCVSCLDFSYDGAFLATKSVDGSMGIWRSDTWQRVASVPEANPQGWGSLEFHPRELTLATLGEDERSVRIWALDRRSLLRDEAG